MIEVYWVKFKELDMECSCRDRKCGKDSNCTEYVVKFTEINREVEDRLREMSKTLKDAERKLTSECNQLKRSINKTKGLKL